MYGQVLGIASAILTLVQWTPQIIETWRTRDTAALSLGTLLVQIPGSLLVVVFQLSAPSSHWTSWAPYIVSTAEMLVLVGLILWIEPMPCCVKCREEKPAKKEKEKKEKPSKVPHLLEEDDDMDLLTLIAMLWRRFRRPSRL